MLCNTVRKGVNCTFMSTKGCSFNGGVCHEIVEQCHGCGRIVHFESASYCSVAPDPSLKWKNGACNMATHIKAAAAAQAKINPLKASKRASRSKKK